MRFPQSIVLIVAVTGALAACHPRDHSEHSGQPGSTQSGQAGQAGQVERRHGGRGIRKLCADDIAKYCQNEDRKKRCLRQNMDKLSADCKAAIEAARGHKRDAGDANKSDNDD